MAEPAPPILGSPSPRPAWIRATVSAALVGTTVGLVSASIGFGLIAAAIAFMGGMRTYGRGERPVGDRARVALTAMVLLGVVVLLWIGWVIATTVRH
jgi:hypothetical protein